MRAIAHLSAGYRALLWVYPPELRDVYGQDMTAVFEQVLITEWTNRGVWGVAVTSCRAVGELLTVAIPERLMNERMISASLSLAINSGVLGMLVWMMLRQPPRFQ